MSKPFQLDIHKGLTALRKALKEKRLGFQHEELMGQCKYAYTTPGFKNCRCAIGAMLPPRALRQIVEAGKNDSTLFAIPDAILKVPVDEYDFFRKIQEIHDDILNNCRSFVSAHKREKAFRDRLRDVVDAVKAYDAAKRKTAKRAAVVA